MWLGRILNSARVDIRYATGTSVRTTLAKTL